MPSNTLDHYIAQLESAVINGMGDDYLQTKSLLLLVKAIRDEIRGA